MKCGYENDRDVIACLNMLRMRRSYRFPFDEFREGNPSRWFNMPKNYLNHLKGE